ncbi:MAG: outer membrane beta-barrel protein [Bacteroidota bacterium]
MKHLFTLTVFLLFAFLVQAKTPGARVTGVLINVDGKPIEAATVSLLQTTDKKVAKVAISDNTGVFELLGIKPGAYYVQVTALGFMQKGLDSINVGAGIDSLQIEMKPLMVSDKQLGGVTVTGRKQLVETKIDRTVVNVDAMISTAGSSALDVLEKSPGIMIDKDGNIIIKGKAGVIVLMDGRPSYLSGQDLANLLKNMPASELEQLEIMTQPPAKFDASGTAGVINIKTKKNKSNGFNGSVSLSYVQGRYPKSPNSLNLNWRKNKFNIFANYNMSYWEGFNELSILRKFRDKNDALLSVFDQTTKGRFYGRNHGVKVGMDYTLSKNTSFGVVLNGTINPRDFNSKGITEIMDGNNDLESYNYSNSKSHNLWKNLGINLNFKQALKKKGSEITADGDYIWYNSQNNQDISNNILFPNGTQKVPPILLKGDLPSDIKIYSFKSDYVLPLKNDAKFEAGVKTSYVTTDNNAIYSTYNQGTGNWTPDNRRSSHFLYDENINAAYVNYSRQMKKWGVQAGLRVENTNGKGQQLKDNTEFERHYTQLFPTLYISRKLNEKNTMVINYGRRIERPNYEDMNPFINFLDSFTYRQGNPYLMPQFTNNIELSHNYKGALNTTLNYTHTTDIINDILQQIDSTQVTFQTKDNIGKRTNIGIAVSYNAPVTKWYTVSLYGNAYNNHYVGVINNVPLDVSMFSYMFNVNNQFRFAKTWGAEVSGFYRSTTQDAGIIIAKPMGVINFAFSKQILKNKGSLKLTISDPFWIQRFSGYTRFDNIDAVIKSKWDNRRVGLTFVYRFGKQMQQAPRRRNTSAAAEEQQRVGNGGGQQ